MDQSKNYGALSRRKKRRRAKIFGKIKTTRVDEPWRLRMNELVHVALLILLNRAGANSSYLIIYIHMLIIIKHDHKRDYWWYRNMWSSSQPASPLKMFILKEMQIP